VYVLQIVVCPFSFGHCVVCSSSRCSGRVSSSCSTSGTCRVNIVTNPVISHERGKDRVVFATSGTYPWSFVTQIFHNGQSSHGGDRKLCYSIFSFMCMFCRSLFVLFLLAIVLSVLLRFTDFDYLFGIFKLFLFALWFHIHLNPLLHEVHTLTKILDTQGTSAHMQKYIRRNWY
jgi:biotin transporter BioY